MRSRRSCRDPAVRRGARPRTRTAPAAIATAVTCGDRRAAPAAGHEARRRTSSAPPFGVSRTIVRAALRIAAPRTGRPSGPTGAPSSPRPASTRPGRCSHARRVVEARADPRGGRARARRPTSPRCARTSPTRAARSRRGDRPAAIRLSGDFHLLLAPLAPAGRAVRLPARARLPLGARHRALRHDPGLLLRHLEHESCSTRVERRDGDRAAALMLHHLSHVEADLDLAPKAAKAADLSSLRQALASG